MMRFETVFVFISDTRTTMTAAMSRSLAAAALFFLSSSPPRHVTEVGGRIAKAIHRCADFFVFVF